MKRLWFQLVLLMVMTTIPFVNGYSQVNLIYNANAYGKSIKDLAFLQIMNSTAQSYSGNLFIEVKNVMNNEVLVKLIIPSLIINSGNNILPASKLSSASITYSSGTEGNYIRQTSMMPEGELEYCFKLLASAKNGPDEVFENCFYRNNIISSPLQLVLPENQDSLCNKRPKFNWQPPLPLQPDAVFELKLVRIEKGQVAAEALIANSPIVYQRNLRGVVMPYPASAPDLSENQQYAWQVIVLSGGKQTLSEIWTFTIGCEKSQPVSGSFRELKSTDDGGYLTTGSSLRIAIDNSYGAKKMDYSIRDLSEPDKKFKRLPDIQFERGINNITIDLNKIPGIEEDHEYLFTVILPGGKKVSVRFKYQEN